MALLGACGGADSLTVATYNIRHGRGIDGTLDLVRTAAAIRALDADIIALQEVDRGVARSDSVDQPDSLARLLGLEHAFGAFFPYQGGEYGMAILSRRPIVAVHEMRLPDGNEPRIALRVDVQLNSGQVLSIVNVHFDWVADDAFRVAQVEALAARLLPLLDSMPVVLLGDFNDLPQSRTLERWADRFAVAAKPATERFTFPADAPEKEIDHILLGPTSAWRSAAARVIDDSRTSDHRAVVSEIRLR